jgi:uncharacterized protein (DUF2147 family)
MEMSLSVLPILLAAAAPTATQATEDGIWRNPAGSVHVRWHRCGEHMCGTVIWANEEAKADAAKGGTRDLVGRALFRDFQERKPGVWRGRVFVPDLNITLSGTVTLVDADTMTGRGCLIAGIGCRSQTWKRVR